MTKATEVLRAPGGKRWRSGNESDRSSYSKVISGEACYTEPGAMCVAERLLLGGAVTAERLRLRRCAIPSRCTVTRARRAIYARQRASMRLGSKVLRPLTAESMVMWSIKAATMALCRDGGKLVH